MINIVMLNSPWHYRSVASYTRTLSINKTQIGISDFSRPLLNRRQNQFEDMWMCADAWSCEGDNQGY